MRHGTRTTQLQVYRNKAKPKPAPKVKTKAILVLRCLGGIGDMLMLTPAIRGIKEKHPDLPLVVCTTAKYPPMGCLFDVLKNNPFIDKVIGLEDLINYDFEKVYNFQTNEESRIEIDANAISSNRIDIFCNLADVKPESLKPIYVITQEEKLDAEGWLQRIPVERRKRLFGIHVSASVNRRSWPREKQLLLAFLLISKYPDSSVLFFEDVQYFTPDLENHANIYHVKNMPLRLVVALVDRCELMIVPDSALLHLAGILDKKIVAIFGSTPPSSRLNYYDKSVAVAMNYDCRPCWYERCHYGFKCLTDIPVEMVMDGVEKALGDQFQNFGKVHKAGLLIIRMGGVGDLIMLSSALRTLKDENPELDITLATLPDNVPLFRGASYLKDCISIAESQETFFDKVKDLRWKVESPEVGGVLNSEVYKTQNRINIFEGILGVKSKEKRFEIEIDSDSVDKMKKRLDYVSDARWLGIQATCTSNLRTIPPEYLEPLVRKFNEIENLRIVLFGRSEFWHGRRTSVDIKAIGKDMKIVNIMDETDLKELVATISLMNFVIAPDSAAVHIAGALNKKCLALFGNVDPFTRIYYYPTVKALYPVGELTCIPCHDFTNPCEHYVGMGFREPVGGKCMWLLTPERIFESGKGWFGL